MQTAMELTSPQAMASFADDVRTLQEPFTTAATEVFASLFPSEYRRLRASALESGATEATLNITARFNFSPEARSVEMVMTPAASQPKPRRKAVAVVPGHAD